MGFYAAKYSILILHLLKIQKITINLTLHTDYSASVAFIHVHHPHTAGKVTPSRNVIDTKIYPVMHLKSASRTSDLNDRCTFVSPRQFWDFGYCSDNRRRRRGGRLAPRKPLG